jgi:hypothetical protein
VTKAQHSHDSAILGLLQHGSDTNGVMLPVTQPSTAPFAISRSPGGVDPTRVFGHVYHTIHMDRGGYGSLLSVGASGVIAPHKYGATGVVAAHNGDKLLVGGTISGGGGKYGRGYNAGGDGGTGVLISAHGTLATRGIISGGQGGGSKYGDGGNGGIGVVLAAGGMLGNAGTITGGDANDSGYGSHGGNGVNINAGQLLNKGTISGGVGGYGGNGGNGVNISGGQLSNKGTISGGTGGDVSKGGAGVVLNSSSLTNAAGAVIVGGISGQFGYRELGGGTGLIATNGVLTNHGHIYGGYSGRGEGGVGAMLTDSTFTNSGNISGGGDGRNGYGGGSGVIITDSTLTNSGSIAGGYGGGGGAYVDGGTLVTSGRISGGYGGMGYTTNGGNGGVGVFGSDCTLLNSGKISGGAGGTGYYYHGGNGGAGVYLNGGTLVTSGSISGGAPGFGQEGSGTRGDAVRLGHVVAALVVDPGAFFEGNVVGDGSNDTLVLAAGANAGTISGLGSQFTGFTTIHEATGAAWTVECATSVGAATALDAAGSLTFAGNVTGSGSVTIDSGATVTAGGNLHVASLVFGAGGAEQLILDAPTAVTSTLSGFGTGDTIDLVNLIANGVSFANGTLSLLEGTSVVASLTLAGNYTSNNFTLASDNNGGTTIAYVAGAGALPGTPPPDFGSSLNAGPAASHNLHELAWGATNWGEPASDWTAALIAHWHVPQ